MCNPWDDNLWVESGAKIKFLVTLSKSYHKVLIN